MILLEVNAYKIEHATSECFSKLKGSYLPTFKETSQYLFALVRSV